MIDFINERIKQLEDERNQLRQRIQAQFERDLQELQARANAAIEPHNAAIRELQAMAAKMQSLDAKVAAVEAEANHA